MDKLWREVKEYDEEIADAERQGNTVLVDTYRREREERIAYLNTIIGPGGRSKNFSDVRDKLRSRIQHALTDAYSMLRNKGMARTADHFEYGIKAQEDCYIYHATPRPEWILKW